MKYFNSYQSTKLLILLRISLIMFFVGEVSWVFGQRFNGSIILGANFSQLEGDNLSGYNKIGLHTGFRLEYPLSDNKGLATELVFNQKGSSSKTIKGVAQNVESITLNYLSLPMIFYWKEWLQTDYYRFQLHAGLSAHRLFSVKSSNSFFNNATEDFANYDLAILGGISYHFSQLLGIGFQIERSLTKIYQLPNSNLRGLQSYLINIRLIYEL